MINVNICAGLRLILETVHHQDLGVNLSNAISQLCVGTVMIGNYAFCEGLRIILK